MIDYPLKTTKIICLILFNLFISCRENNERISVLNFDKNLKKTERGWIYKGKPFTGFMIQEEKDHRIVYQLPIENSKENGVAKGWYNSGEKLLERIYIDGKREGIFKQWWPNGQLRYLFNYENDVFQGKQIVYFPNGKIREESNYQSGKKEGIQRVWDEKDLLISNYTIKNQKLYGVITVKSCIPTGH
jgi:antitoxin component YwqK of YwqJK toxin-antitoxin module